MTRAEGAVVGTTSDIPSDRFSASDIERMGRCLTAMRAGGVHAIRAWMDATEAGLGGRLVLQAPSKINGKGHLPEAAFQSQFWVSLVSGDAPQ